MAGRQCRWVLVFLALACTSRNERGPLVWVAASFVDAARSVAGGDPSFSVQVAASSVLARQIVEGAPGDCFVSANSRWMDYVEKEGRIVSGTRQTLVHNTLVVVALKETGQDVLLESFEGLLAMGDPRHVPAGMYGEQALRKSGLWPQLESHIVATADARAALALVERGEVDLALVYETDAKVSDAVRVVHRFAAAESPTVVYEIALLAGGDLAILRRLTGTLARAKYEELGFSVPER